MATFEDFEKLDIRVGEITHAEPLKKARKPAYRLLVDFGEEIGVKKSSAQITDCYRPEQLIGRQVLGVVNFPPRQIADFFSEVLVLGVYTQAGVVLIAPERPVQKGDRLG
jgi:tRNA-binding protein